MATAPGTNMLSTNFWLIIVHPVRVKTYRSLKFKFFVKVRNKVHVTIGHVCDFARNYGPAQNDFKVKFSDVLWNFVLSNTQMTETHNYLQTISSTSYEILSSGFLLMQYFVWSRLWHFGVTFGSRLWHFWYRPCAHSCTDRKASQFFLEILLKYRVTNWWIKNLLMWSNKEADFFPEINKSFTFPGMGQLLSSWFLNILFKLPSGLISIS